MTSRLPRLFAAGAVVALWSAPGSALAAHPLTEARIAQRDGRYEDCVRHADEARRVKFNTFHAHRLYANCLVSAADARREDLGEEGYAREIDKAIEALQLIARTPGARHETKANDMLAIAIESLQKMARAARGQ